MTTKEIDKLTKKVETYIDRKWGAKPITSAIGFEHWLFINEVLTDLKKIQKLQGNKNN